MTLLGWILIASGIFIFVLLVMTNFKDWLLEALDFRKERIIKEKEIKELTYEHEVIYSPEYESDHKNFFFKTRRLDKDQEIAEKTNKFLDIHGQRAYELEKTRIELENNRIELEKNKFSMEFEKVRLQRAYIENESLEVQNRYYMILERAEAQYIIGKSQFERDKWTHFKTIVHAGNFSNLDKMTQVSIVDALFNNIGANNADDFYSKVMKDINLKTKKENLKTKKMENDQEHHRQQDEQEHRRQQRGL